MKDNTLLIMVILFSSAEPGFLFETCGYINPVDRYLITTKKTKSHWVSFICWYGFVCFLYGFLGCQPQKVMYLHLGTIVE